MYGSTRLLRRLDQLTLEQLFEPARVATIRMPALEISSPCVRRRATAGVAWDRSFPTRFFRAREYPLVAEERLCGACAKTDARRRYRPLSSRRHCRKPTLARSFKAYSRTCVATA